MTLTTLRQNSKRSFIRQQGLEPPHDPESESILYSALQLQPRVIGGLVLTSVVFHSPEIFLAISAALLCSAIAPRWNPFNALYNYTLGAKRGLFLLRSAPPRRFAEAMAGSFAGGIGLFWALGQNQAALVLTVVFVVANAAVVFSRRCFGAFLFFWLKNKPFCGSHILPTGYSRHCGE